MKLTLASLALPLLGAAAPAPASSGKPFSAQTDTTEMPFSVLAARSASPIHYHQMQANSTKFWLSGKTNSSCPDVAANKGSCPPGDQTNLGPDGDAMYAMVPGGQRVYVDSHGALRFTQPHSSVIPEGATNEGFSHAHAPTVAGSTSPDHYTFNNWGANGFMACPAGDSRWQVFAAIQNATVPQGNRTACLGFSALAVPYNNTNAGAWQYN